MKTASRNPKQSQAGTILAYFIMVMILASAIASVSAYVASTVRVAHRRNDMIAAREFARGGAVVACNDIGLAFTNSVNGFPGNLGTGFGYTVASTTSSETVYQRTISTPFTNQTVLIQIKVPAGSVNKMKVVATATVGEVTQTVTANTLVSFGYGAAIISVNSGTSSTSVGKSAAQDGNVVVDGSGSGTTVVDGGTGYTIWANGQANIDASAGVKVPPGSVSKTNWGQANQIPDFTAQGTTNALFDFGRYIACSDLTTNAYNTNSHNNHFTNVATFANAIRLAPNHTLEGVITVDIRKSDNNYNKAGDDSYLPYGINVRGTLFYNFGPEFGVTDKFVVTTDLNVNPANLSTLVATNSATYPSGYPPIYTDWTKNPTNIDITSRGYAKFTATEDLPALMNSIGEVDIHGNVNVSGVVYTPSYAEIENKVGTMQYFKGTVIVGNGVYYENNNKATSIISYDPTALDFLATATTVGKTVKVAYWQ